jgi:hypothetical protein
VLSLPEELLRPWPYKADSLYVRLRFEGVYGELRVGSLFYEDATGERRQVAVTPADIRYQSRPHSGVEYYAEIRSELEPDDVENLEILYTALPEPRLSAGALAIVEKARINLKARQVQS